LRGKVGRITASQAIVGLERAASFSGALRWALVVPAIAWSLALLAAGFLEPRSPALFLVGAIMLLCSLIELLVVPVAFWRLAMNVGARTRRNVLLTMLGALCLLPAIVIYVYVMLTETH
jgi:hypothetical protein